LLDIDPELLTDTCGATPSWICRTLLESTERPGMARAADVLLARPLKIALVIGLAWLANGLIRRAIRRFVTKIDDAAPSLRAAARTRTIAQVLRSISASVIWILAVMTVLGELGINLGPLIAGAGIAGLALGFGAQSLVKDFLSGIFMLVEDQYGVGDIIDAGEATGTVEAVTLRSTKLRAVDGTVWHIPNGQIARVGNKSQQWARALLDIGVAYGTDLDTAQRVIKETADALWRDPEWADRVLEEPEVWGVEHLGADGILIRLVVKTQPSEQFRVMRALRSRINDAFVREGIATPSAQRIVTVRHDADADAPTEAEEDAAAAGA
jgi:small conductance mechanosensitive channel